MTGPIKLVPSSASHPVRQTLPNTPVPNDPIVGTGAPGVMGQSNLGIGVVGRSLGPWASTVGGSASDGVLGEGKVGVHGVSSYDAIRGGVGVLGENKSNGHGVQGTSANGEGVFGQGKNGVHGRSGSPNDSGVWGENIGGGYGVAGSTSGGKPGLNESNGAGVWGSSTNATGVMGTSTTGIGIFGRGGTAAGSFEGNVIVAGEIIGSSHISAGGDLQVAGELSVQGEIVLAAADGAEEFEVAWGICIEPGTVMVLGDEGMVSPGETAYDKRVAGVVSGDGEQRPGLILHKLHTGNRVPIALFGTVNCMVDATYSPIEIGDLLTTSPTSGHAMKAKDSARAFGAVIGKALRPFKQGQGIIPILVALQ